MKSVYNMDIDISLESNKNISYTIIQVKMFTFHVYTKGAFFTPTKLTARLTHVGVWRW